MKERILVSVFVVFACAFIAALYASLGLLLYLLFVEARGWVFALVTSPFWAPLVIAIAGEQFIAKLYGEKIEVRDSEDLGM